jgi:hypothetical protein
MDSRAQAILTQAPLSNSLTYHCFLIAAAIDMNIFAFLFTIGLFMASVAGSSTASSGFSHSLRSLEDVKEEPPPKEDESRNRAPVSCKRLCTVSP